MLLKQIKDDTASVDVSTYNGTSVYFCIYDPVFGKDYLIGVGPSQNMQISKDDLFSFFYRHSEDSIAYVFSNAIHISHGYFTFSSFYFSLNDTTEIQFKNPI